MANTIKYKTVEEFKNENKNKKPNGYWTLERCKEDAKKYKTKTEWARSKSCAYNIASINKWITECSLHMFEKHKPAGYWDDIENVKAKALTFSTKSEWNSKSSASYRAAKKNGWFEEISASLQTIRKPNGFWTKEKCLEEALKYSSVKEWKENNGSSYNSAKLIGWYDECVKHMKKDGI